ncbi:MAG: glycosyltransferase family 9 protein [Planctomycetota bacterium]
MQLVFHQAALGDFVLALPTLRRLSPEAGPVTLIVPWSHGRTAARLMPEARLLDAEMFEFTRLWSEEGPSTVSPAVAEVFEASTRVVNFVANSDSAWARNIQRLCGSARLVTVPPRPPSSWAEPIRRWHAQQLEQQAVKLVPESDATRHGSLAAPKPTSGEPVRRWAIHPGSGGVAKFWPVGRFASIAQALIEQGDTCVFLLGPAEIERGLPGKLREHVGDAVRIRKLTDIDDLCFALAEATHYLGNDAGPTHLAAQLGMNTTVIFGPSDPHVWGPCGPYVDCVAPPEPTIITWLSAEVLLDRLDVN